MYRFHRATLAAFICVAIVPVAFADDLSARLDEAGDKTRTPIVFVHGQNGAGDQFERQWMHFHSNGYPASWVVPFDYNTSVRSGGPGGPGRRERPEGPYKSGTTDDLEAFIDALRERTGFDKINLVGHSRGTFESSAYLSDPARAAKIAKYASIGGGDATNPNGVPSIAISGMGDFRPGPAASDGGVVGWMPAYQDHVMVCTSDESFWELFTFLNNGVKPGTILMTPEENPILAGYVKSYIHNMPLEGASVEIWEVEPDTGFRMKKKPVATMPVNAQGAWGPFTAKAGQPYEFVVHGTASRVPLRFFRTPFTHSDLMIYFRIAANAENYQASPFDNAPDMLTDKSAAFVVRHQNGSMVPGVMTLTMDGIDLIVDPIVPVSDEPRQAATVAIYLADGNANGKTELSTLPGFGGAFVSSADVFVAANPKKSVQFKLNDNVLNVPALPASEAGAISVVFEDFN